MSAQPLEILAAAARGWGAPLDDAAVSRLRSYLEDVRARNATVNLTADDAWEDLVFKHAADGVFAAAALRRALAARDAPARPRVLDLGAGAGFIGFALKIAWPAADVSLMEASERKHRFLNAAAAKLGLPGVRPLRRRAGAAPRSAYETGFDAVVERALAPLAEAAALGLPLLGPRGVFAAFQSEPADSRAGPLARVLAAARARVLECRPYRRPGEARERCLMIFARQED